MDFIMEIIASFFRLFLFLLIPFGFYYLSGKKDRDFLKCLGFFHPGKKGIEMGILSIPLFALLGYGLSLLPFFQEIFLAPLWGAGNLREAGLGFGSLLSLILIAIIKKGLAEEIFFRGFIARQLIENWGFPLGNAMQAAVFGIFQILFLTLPGVEVELSTIFLSLFFLLQILTGFILGAMQMVVGEGSIIPPVIARSGAHIIGLYYLAFVL